jgi:AraC-like DNA-binding protein
LEQIRPLIRIAHRGTTLNIRPRVIVDHEFVLVLDGTGEFVFSGQRLPFAPHDLFFLPPFVLHSIVPVTGTGAHLAVHFDFAPGIPAARRDLLRRAPYAVQFPQGLALPRRTALVAGERLEQEFTALVDAWQNGGNVGELEATASLLRILATLFRRQLAQPGARGKARIERALAMLRTTGQTVSVAALAQAAGLSVSHFNREFREWTGYSPVEYQRRRRVARARELLADVTLSIKEVAARVGFDDPYHFSRLFRQVDGLSPSQYRDAALASRAR